MSYNTFRETLVAFAEELEKVLNVFEVFLKTHDINYARELPFLLTRTGMVFHGEFTEYSHSVLARSLLVAGSKVRERVGIMEERGVTSEDLEYFRDIYNVFMHIYLSIKSGEYEECFHKMMEKRETGKRVKGDLS